jgi:hypothetical protein
MANPRRSSCRSTLRSRASARTPGIGNALVAAPSAPYWGDWLFSVPLCGSSQEDLAPEINTKTPEGVATGAGTGAAVGGVLGWLVGIGALAIPGVGSLVAAGPIVAARTRHFQLGLLRSDCIRERALSLASGADGREMGDGRAIFARPTPRYRNRLDSRS